MNRAEYMQALEQELRRLPKEERERALDYYREYFEDAGAENEAAAILELGSPRETAAQIIHETAIKKLDHTKESAKRGWSTLWVVILAICALPIGLPFAITFIVVGLALLISVIAVVLSLGFSGIVAVAAAVISAVAGVILLPSEFASGIVILGSGILALGLGLLLIVATAALTKLLVRGFTSGAKRILTGGKTHEEIQ